MQFEGLAAAFADRHGLPPPLPGGWQLAGDAIGELDLRPLLAALAAEANPHYGAALFHATFAAALAAWVKGAARQHGVTTIVAAGGCLLNQVLAQALRQQLYDADLLLLEACSAPPNDGGLALGQAWVAMNQEV